ncbi:Protein of unknown function [bacterium A37T11]|nr:Protein of unknown function [bacterium A37T11]
MNTRNTFFYFYLLITLTILHSCKKDDDPSTKKTGVEVGLINPPNLEISKFTSLNISFQEINSGTSQTISQVPETNSLSTTLPEGAYNVSLEGEAEYSIGGVVNTIKIRGYKENFVVSGSSVNLSLPLFVYNENAGFVFQEIYFTGSVTPEGKQYSGDKYIILKNNSNEVLYADSLVIAQSSFLTTSSHQYTPDLMSEAFTSGEIIMIPGSGKDHPVQPGATYVIAENAINHKEYNVNSIDLSHADLEIPLLASINVDNPQVPDAINITRYIAIHNRGFRSFVLAKFNGINIDNFKTANYYTYSYTLTSGTTLNLNAYKIPNTLIADAVNLSVASEFQMIVTDPSLDMGWTYCGTVDADPNRYGKSVQRKVLSTSEDGQQILQDTNNSTVDFNAEQVPSLQ